MKKPTPPSYSRTETSEQLSKQLSLLYLEDFHLNDLYTAMSGTFA